MGIHRTRQGIPPLFGRHDTYSYILPCYFYQWTSLRILPLPYMFCLINSVPAVPTPAHQGHLEMAGARTAGGLGSPEGSPSPSQSSSTTHEHVHLQIPLQWTNISRREGTEGGIRSCREAVTKCPTQAGAPSARKYPADTVRSGPAMPHAQGSMAGEYPPRSTSEGLCLCHT